MSIYSTQEYFFSYVIIWFIQVVYITDCKYVAMHVYLFICTRWRGKVWKFIYYTTKLHIDTDVAFPE